MDKDKVIQDELNALQKKAAEKHARNVDDQRKAAGLDPRLPESNKVHQTVMNHA